MVFYTQNGWAGSNYDSNLSMVDICKKIREFCKQFKGYKFSVRKRDYSCLIIDLKESPVEITNAERMYNFFANEKASGLGWRKFWIDEKNLEWSDLTEEQKQIVSKNYAESWCKYHQLNGNPDCDWLNPEVKEVFDELKLAEIEVVTTKFLTKSYNTETLLKLENYTRNAMKELAQVGAVLMKIKNTFGEVEE